MKKRTKRLLATLLASVMILQQGSTVGVLATEETGELPAETIVTEASAPETQAPEVQAPAPETQAPETQAPETKAPETQAPETKAPETQAPETKAPETQAPETPAPETQAPEPVTEAKAPAQEMTETAAATENATEKLTETETQTSGTEETAGTQSETPDAPTVEAGTDVTVENVAEAIIESEESEAETEAPKTDFIYEDARVKITATAQPEAKLPQDAQIHADYMQPGTPEYQAAAAALEAAYAGQDVVLDYVFYDIYFTAASAGEGRIEPEAGTVAVSMQFMQPELVPETEAAQAADEAAAAATIYDVMHVENGKAQEVPSTVQTTGDGSVASVGFTSGDFSPYAIVSKQLVAVRKIAAPSGMDVPMAIDADEFTEEFQDLRPFLTSDGVQFEGALMQDGKFLFEKNTEYKLKLKFAEDGTGKQFKSDCYKFSYQMPEGFPVKEYEATPINIVITGTDGNDYSIPGTYSVKDGKLEIILEKGDVNFYRFLNSTDVSLNLEFGFSFTEDIVEKDFEFSDSVTKKVTTEAKPGVAVNKESKYDPGTGKVTYTITVSSTGENNDVKIDDTITGSALKLNQDVKVQKKDSVSPESIEPQYKEGGQGFTLSIPSMNNGDVYIVTYTADIDYSKFNGNIDGNAIYTGNSVSVQPEGKEVSEDKDTVEHISHYRVKKSDGKVTGESGGNKTVSWEININEDKLEVFKDNLTVTDTLETEGLFYSGNGLKITVDGYEPEIIFWSELGIENLNEVRSWMIRDLKSLLKEKKLYSDGQKVAVKIEYDTTINTAGQAGDKEVINKVNLDGVEDKGSASVPGTGDVTYGKSVFDQSNAEETVEWKINFTVSGTVSPCDLKDTLPSTYVEELNRADSEYPGGKIYDTLLKETVNVKGLCPNESYDIEDEEGGFCLRFYHVETGINVEKATPDQKKYGLEAKPDDVPHDIVINYKTKTNRDWLKSYPNGTAGSTHTNTVQFDNMDSKTASVTITEKSVLKFQISNTWQKDEHGYFWYNTNVAPPSEVDISGVKYPALYFGIVLSGVNSSEAIVTDTFNASGLKYYESYTPVLLAGDKYGLYLDKAAGALVESKLEEGTITFKVTNIPKDSTGGYYKNYAIVYCMIPKDAAALKQLLNHNTFKNKAKYGNSENEIDVSWDYDALDKTAAGSDWTKNVVTFTIDYNPNGYDLLQGTTEEITFVDSMDRNHMRFLADTLRVTANDEELTAGEDYNYDYMNGTLMITIFDGDEKHIKITYNAQIIGEGSVTYTNTVNVSGSEYSDSVSDSWNVSTDGAGNGGSLKITLHKYRKGFMTQSLPGAVYQLFMKSDDGEYVPLKKQSGEWNLYTTDESGNLSINSDNTEMVSDSGEMLYGLFKNEWYRLVEIQAPKGYTLDDTPVDFYFDEDGKTGANKYFNGDTIYVANAKENFHIVKKDVDTGAVLKGAIFKLYKESACTEPAVAVAVSDAGGNASFEGLKAGTYYLKETSAPAGYELPDPNPVYEVTIDTDGKVSSENEEDIFGILSFETDDSGNYFGTITNKKSTEEKGQITVTKQVEYNGDSEDVTGTFYVALFRDSAGNIRVGEIKGISLSNASSGSTTFTNLDLDSYYVFEVDAAGNKVGNVYLEKYVVSGGGIVTLSESHKNDSVTITNDRKTVKQSFSVMKAANGWTGIIPNIFQFTVTAVSDETNTPMPTQTTVTNDGANVSFGEIEYEKAGEYIYKIEETDYAAAATDVQKEEWTLATSPVYVKVTVTRVEGTGELTVTANYYSDIECRVPIESSPTITNTYTQQKGSLKLSKVVSGATEAATDKTFKFTVKGPDGKYYDEDGTTSGEEILIEVTPGKDVTLTNLPVGVYTVAEKDAQVSGYTLNVTGGGAVAVNADETVNTTITNTYTQQTGSLKVTKITTGATATPDDATFTVTNEAGNTVAEKKYSDFKETGYFKVDGLPAGNYTVTESGAEVTNYVLSVTGDTTATVTKDDEATVSITNTYMHEDAAIATLSGTKTLDSKSEDIPAFTFKIQCVSPDSDGNVVIPEASVINDSTGKFKFTGLSFGSQGEYMLQVVEQANSDQTIIYDSKTYTIVVKVEEVKDSTGRKKLEVTNVTVDGVKVDKSEDGSYPLTPGKVTFANKTTTIKVDKVDEKGNKLSGAKLQVTVKNAVTGEAVDSWTTNDKVHDITGKLEVGKTYVLEETDAPTGYAVSAPIEFAVDEDGDITVGGKKVDDNLLTMTDAKLHFNVNKTELGTGDEVEGAELEVLDKNGKVVESWTSKKGETHDFGSKLKAGEKYTLREKVAPDGYGYVTDIEFTVKEDGTIETDMPKTTDEKTGETTYLVEDARIRLEVNKKALGTGEELSGAKLELLDSTGKVLDSWVSEAGRTHDFGKFLKAGGSYTLRESVAPNGYTVVTDMKFTVTEAGTVTGLDDIKTTDASGKTAYVVEDSLNEISIQKVDETGAAVRGAKLVIKDAADRIVESWTTDGKAHDLSGYGKGKYTLSEVEAPEGYQVAEDVPFEVTGTEKAGTVIALTMMDTKKPVNANRSLRVTKHLRLDGISSDVGVHEAVYYVALYSDEAREHRVSNVKKIEFRDSTTSSVLFNNLGLGTYYVGETDENGTKLVSKKVNDRLVFYPEYGAEAAFTFEGSTTEGVAEFTNVYVELPAGFYLSGRLTVTKRFLVGGVAAASNDTYYARVFSDKALTKPASDVLALSLGGSSSASITVTDLPIGETLDSSATYYVAETDVNGTPLDPAAVTGYKISIDKSEVVLNNSNWNQEVVITNDYAAAEEEHESESEFETEYESESEFESETEVEETKTAPKTGDDTDYMRYLLLMALSAGTCAVDFGQKRRKKRAGR